jgi:signal transduction histidine kinase
MWVSLGLGILTALIGILGARQLTRRLRSLASSVRNIGHDETPRSRFPAASTRSRNSGAHSRDSRGSSRRAPRTRASRCRQDARGRALAEESRYAAVVRERLKIARDLHDTLAHSMMAILSEIRLLRRLHARDPAALAAELERAEAVAHEGLSEARSAISQMRVDTVRETGLGPALASAFDKFIDRTGLSGEFSADDEAARFGDERGEAFLRIALEALRNIEKHAMATRVNVRLQIADGRQFAVADRGQWRRLRPAIGAARSLRHRRHSRTGGAHRRRSCASRAAATRAPR